MSFLAYSDDIVLVDALYGHFLPLWVVTSVNLTKGTSA
jgi:hypothetical protein